MWKEVAEYEELYEVSSMGEIKALSRRVPHRTSTRSYPEKVLVPRLVNGYPTVALCKNGTRKHFSVHRLVAEAFIPKPNIKWEVNHKDGNKQNNNVSNLEWITRSENVKHAYRIGLRDACKQTGRARKVAQFSHDGKRKIATYDKIKQAEKYLGTCKGSISQCCCANLLSKNKLHRSFGFVWRYV